jgi:uncharacterized protein with von Willebrand factor type A (vWA) domain
MLLLYCIFIGYADDRGLGLAQQALVASPALYRNLGTLAVNAQSLRTPRPQPGSEDEQNNSNANKETQEIQIPA